MSEELKRFGEIAKDLHRLVLKRAKQKEYTQAEILAWLTATLVGTCELRGQSQEFFNETCEMMKIDFAKKREDRTE